MAISTANAGTSGSGYSLPWFLRAANRAELGLRRMGLRAVDLGEESLLAEARRRTGLERFSDYDFLTPMRRLLAAYENEADLSLFGRFIVRTSSLGSLVAQLRYQEEIARHPEILDVPIEKPLFILGFPRTGTTLLQNLLACGAKARALDLWELDDPVPAIGPETSADDPRILAAEKRLEGTYRVVPALRSVHCFDARSPDECVLLFRKVFTCPTYGIEAHVPSYMDWIRSADMVPAYREYKKLLQLLAWKWPGRYLVLKSPLHLFFIDALLEVFPDARIVQTHRDPSTVAASGCSLYEVLRTLYNVKADPAQIGRDWLDSWGSAMDRALVARSRAHPRHFYDLLYDDLVGDPIGATRRIHEYFGIEFDHASGERCRQWIDGNPSEKHGAHRYSCEHYALDPHEIRERFAEYMKQYGL